TTSRTKLLIINYPNNPSGKVLSEADLCELKTYLRKHPDVYVISDEIYEKLIYDGNVHISPASDPEFFSRIILINGFSKCSAMTGWRVGYLACNPEIYKAALKIYQHSMSCTSSFVQKGALAALKLPEETERMRSAYEHRKNIIYEAFRDIPEIEFKNPEGSFYAWVRFNTDKSSEEICTLLLEEAGIGGIPGAAYGVRNGCFVRFCFASSDEVLTEFTARMKDFCRKFL
ncbi:MAG: aminotransferase class I/II-fold pyridoxal phosphate-dependent enzyme, partial [Parasporobacterium sp.]|nr:aminotransferase class I/II-fold pyridoxal phosphate-dependent enzyme [Parasporobacterium sp.]